VGVACRCRRRWCCRSGPHRDEPDADTGARGGLVAACFSVEPIEQLDLPSDSRQHRCARWTGAGRDGVDTGWRILHGRGRSDRHRRERRRDACHERFATDSSRVRRRFLDGQDGGHQSAVRCVREGDRLCHRGRADAACGRFSGCPKGKPGRRFGYLLASTSRRAVERSFSVVGVCQGRQLAPSDGTRQLGRGEGTVPRGARRV